MRLLYLFLILATAHTATAQSSHGINEQALEELRIASERAHSNRDAALEDTFGPQWWDVLNERFQGTGVDPVFRREYGEMVAYYGDGYLGQTLMIIPEHKIVAVRQVQRSSEYDPETDGFREFKELVLQLVKD